MKTNIYSLIPEKVNNKVVLFFLELLRKLQIPIKEISKRNLQSNQDNILKHIDIIDIHGGYIEDQNNYTDMKYGKKTIQYSGCEVIAVYNAIFSLVGRHAFYLEDLIKTFENNGMVLTGRFGTSPKALYSFFNKNGFISRFTSKESEFEAVSSESDSIILTFYNDRKDIRNQIHTVSITKENGYYTAHNVYCNGTILGPCSSVTDLIHEINDGKAKGISLIGIKRKSPT